MGLLSNLLFGKKPEPEPEIVHPTFGVADLQVKTLLKFKDPNDDYRLGKKGMSELCVPEDKVYQYFFNTYPELIKTDNEIRLIDLFDNGDEAYIGKISDEDYEEVSTLMDSPEWKYYFVVTGGKYKIIHEHFDRKIKDYTYDLEKGEEPYSAKIEVVTDGNR